MTSDPVPCPVCGLPVVRPKNPGRGRPRKYCSTYCSAVALVGQWGEAVERRKARKKPAKNR